MKKLIKNIVFVLMGCGMFCFILSLGPLSCGNTETANERIKRITGIEIPNEAKLEFEYIGETFSGRASAYFVYKFEEEPIEFLEKDYTELALVNEDKTKVSFKRNGLSNYYQESINQHMNNCAIPEDKRIDFAKEYQSLVWRAFLIYDIESRELFFCDRGH